MRSDQHRTGLLHAICVEVVGYGPYVCSPDGSSAPGDPVPIDPSSCVVPRVELVRDDLREPDDDVVRQQRVQAVLDILDVKPGLRMKARHLAERVNAGVGAAGSDQCDVLLEEGSQTPLERSLDGPPVRLDLPAVEGRAVVFDEEADVATRHRVTPIATAAAERSKTHDNAT